MLRLGLVFSVTVLSQASSITVEESERVRSRGPGRFFALDREIWSRLWQVPAANTLNLVTCFLVLLAGTGGDNRTTKWSAKACEEWAGVGKPRAKEAIRQLILSGILEETETSSPMHPHYRFAESKKEKEPIFLPVEMVTGLGNEVPAVRRIRETNDPLLLRMFVDLYGLVEVDAPFGIAPKYLKMFNDKSNSARKVMESGVHAVWGLEGSDTKSASGEWAGLHVLKSKDRKASWSDFWGRIQLLRDLGLLWFEAWVFTNDADDAEPMFPVDLEGMYAGEFSKTVELTRIVTGAAAALVGERTYLLDNFAGQVLVPLPLHHSQPSLRGVAKLRIEADTPGRRRAYALRMEKIDRCVAAYSRLADDAANGSFSRPLNLYQKA